MGQLTREQMTVVFPNFRGRGIETARALVGVRSVALPHGLHVFTAVRVQEEHHGVVLYVVQPLHCGGSDVQQGMLVLKCQMERLSNTRLLKTSLERHLYWLPKVMFSF